MRQIKVRRLTVIAWANVITCVVSISALYFVLRYPITERAQISEIQRRLDRLERGTKLKDDLIITWMPQSIKDAYSPQMRADLGIK